MDIQWRPDRSISRCRRNAPMPKMFGLADNGRPDAHRRTESCDLLGYRYKQQRIFLSGHAVRHARRQAEQQTRPQICTLIAGGEDRSAFQAVNSYCTPGLMFWNLFASVQ